jgi:hypothetical protein
MGLGVPRNVESSNSIWLVILNHASRYLIGGYDASTGLAGTLSEFARSGDAQSRADLARQVRGDYLLNKNKSLEHVDYSATK